MVKKKKDEQDGESSVDAQVNETQHSGAVNPHDPDFVNDGTSGALNPHE